VLTREFKTANYGNFSAAKILNFFLSSSTNTQSAHDRLLKYGNSWGTKIFKDNPNKLQESINSQLESTFRLQNISLAGLTEQKVPILQKSRIAAVESLDATTNSTAQISRFRFL
jgi:hypothetical protein